VVFPQVSGFLRVIKEIEFDSLFRFYFNAAVLLSLTGIELVPKPLAGFLGFYYFFQLALGIKYSDFLKHGSLLSPAGNKIRRHNEGETLSSEWIFKTPNIFKSPKPQRELQLNIFSSKSSHLLFSKWDARQNIFPKYQNKPFIFK